MIYFHWIAGGILALAWFSRIVDAAFGMQTVADISGEEWDRCPAGPGGNPRVSIIVPARNEGADIEQSLTQLLHLDYDNYEVIAVDDRSTDCTGEIMDAMEATAPASGILRVVHIETLPSGWLGKPYAMWTAANLATGDWLLFTDADVLFKSDSVRRALAYAQVESADHVVLFPQIIMKQPGERMMIAFFQALFVFGHRPWKVADPKAKDHIGVGAFNLLRRKVYDEIGTYQALRFEVVDDMKLGKVVKEAGYAQRNVFGEDLISLYWAKGAMGVVNNLTKNFFAVLSFQAWRVVLCCVGLAFLNLMPFLGVFVSHRWGRVPYAIALMSMFLIYAGMSRKSRIPPYYFLSHPVSTVLFLYTLLRSMFLTLRQGGIVWRGTKYPLDELKKGLV
jgi:glycosyltransferase involved in cell wall biosynthesis